LTTTAGRTREQAAEASLRRGSWLIVVSGFIATTGLAVLFLAAYGSGALLALRGIITTQHRS
jgi:preprotein translocase subunit SecD